MATTRTTRSSTARRAAAAKSTTATRAAARSAASKSAGNTTSTSRRASKQDPSRKAPAEQSVPAADGAPAVEPTRALNSLAIRNAGKLAELQIGAMRRYCDALFSGCREITDLNNPEAVQAFVARQPQAVHALTTAAAGDLQAAAHLGMAFFKDARDILDRARRPDA